MIYAFAILASPASNHKPVSILGIEIAYIEAEKLVVAVAQNFDFETIKTDEAILIQAALEHDRLICELFAKNTLLPLRFGTVFKSQAVLKAYLLENAATFLAKLNFLKGCGEYVLTLVSPDSNISAGSQLSASNKIETKPASSQILTGKDYLLSKRAQYQAAETLKQQQQAQCQALIALLPTQKQVVAPPKGEFLRAYFLANSDQIAELEPKIQDWHHKFSHWQLELSKPLPPYHFCE